MKTLVFLIVLSTTALACSSTVNGSDDPGAGGKGSGGNGTPVSCRSSAECAPDQFCHIPDGFCGDSEAGTCVDMPTACSDGPWESKSTGGDTG